MPFPVALALVGGAGVVAVTKGTPAPLTREQSIANAVETNPEIGNGTQPGATVTQLRNLGTAFAAKRNAIMASSAAPQPNSATTDLWGVAQPTVSGQIDAALQEKLDTINAYGKAAYDKLSDEAKQKGAAILNDQLNLDPPLSGDEDWETIAKISGGAVGTAALGWLPGGQVIGPMVGAYLGVKIEDLISKNSDEIKDWFKSKWSDIEGWVKGQVSDGYNAVTDFFKDLV